MKVLWLSECRGDSGNNADIDNSTSTPHIETDMNYNGSSRLILANKDNNVTDNNANTDSKNSAHNDDDDSDNSSRYDHDNEKFAIIMS